MKRTITKNHWRVDFRKITNCLKWYGTHGNHRYRKKFHQKFISGPIVFQKERKAAKKIRDIITPKNRHCLRGVDGKYIQWNEILRDELNGKLKIIQNQRTESDSESEEGEIDDEKSDFENHDTSEKTAATDQ